MMTMQKGDKDGSSKRVTKRVRSGGPEQHLMLQSGIHNSSTYVWASSPVPYSISYT
jgi:hypothetical protein